MTTYIIGSFFILVIYAIHCLETTLNHTMICNRRGLPHTRKWYNYFGISRFKKIANDGVYELIHDTKLNRFYAGCRNFTYEESVKHWTKNVAIGYFNQRNRAEIFVVAINRLPEKYKK